MAYLVTSSLVTSSASDTDFRKRQFDAAFCIRWPENMLFKGCFIDRYVYIIKKIKTSEFLKQIIIPESFNYVLLIQMKSFSFSREKSVRSLSKASIVFDSGSSALNSSMFLFFFTFLGGGV